VHSLVDGVVIGGSFRVSATIGSRVAVAIVLHKIPDGFVIASLLTATNRSRKPLWVLALSSITPVGAVVGYALLTGIPARFGSIVFLLFVFIFFSSVLGGVLGFAAGTFLFISACGIIPELLHEHEAQKSKLPVLAVVAGWAGILVVNLAFGAHEH
jgi:zinc transporter ZupT